MRICYISAHQTLEYDECSLLHNLGHDVFSIGHYSNPTLPIDATKPGQPFPFNKDLYSQFCRLHNTEQLFNNIGNLKCGDLPRYTIRLKREFTKNFDVIILVYYQENLTLNWDVIKDKRIILRRICQLPYHVSPYLKKVVTVDLAGTEEQLTGHKGNFLIRHACDTDFHKGYVGGTNQVLSVQKWMLKRGPVSSFDHYDAVTKPFNRVVCGFGNEDLPYAKSGLSQPEIQELRNTCSCYYSVPSKPGNLTYSFIEALSSGCPVITCSKKIGNYQHYQNFEADDFIKNGINGFATDEVYAAQDYIKFLIDSPETARLIGENGRKTALKEFSIQRATRDWDELLRRV